MASPISIRILGYLIQNNNLDWISDSKIWVSNFFLIFGYPIIIRIKLYFKTYFN